MGDTKNKGFLAYLKSTLSYTYWALVQVEEEQVQEDLDTLESLELGLYIPDYRD